MEARISLILLNIIGGVCLLLWGARMVRRGFMHAYGQNLREILRFGTQSRPRAFGSGIVITALLQSSTATAILLTSFAKKGFLALPASLAVIIGADISTTLVAQVLSFDLSWLAPLFITLGFIVHSSAKVEGKKRHISRILLGLGFMLLSLNLIRAAAMPIRSSEILPLIIQPLSQDPLLAIVLAAIITWIIHSSLASVLLFASLAASNVIDIHLGVLLILGANLGGALIPMAVTWKDGAYAQQITVGNALMRAVILIITAPFIAKIPELLAHITDDTSRQLVHFHTLFNIALAIVFLPLVSVVAKICDRLLPYTKLETPHKVTPQYLDEKSVDAPVVALSQATRETLYMADIVESMLENTIQAFKTGNPKLIKDIRNADDDVDRLFKAIKKFMASLSQGELAPAEAERSIQILTFATNLEHIGDIIDKSLMNLAEKKIRKKESFSDAGSAEIQSFHDRVLDNLRLAQAIFTSKDERLAKQLVDGKHAIRTAANASNEQHFERLTQGLPESIATSSIHLDIIRDYRQINSYAARIAFSVLGEER